MAKTGIRKNKDDKDNIDKDVSLLNQVEAQILIDKASIVNSISILDTAKSKYNSDNATKTDIANIESLLDFVDRAKLV